MARHAPEPFVCYPLDRREERPGGFIWLLVAEQVREPSGALRWEVFLLYAPLPEHAPWWPPKEEPLRIMGRGPFEQYDATGLERELERQRRLLA